MPAWLHLTDDELGAVADHVMLISRQSLKEQLRTKLFANSKLKPEALEKKLNKTVDDRLLPEDPVHPGPEPAFGAEDVVQARAMFTQVCGVCHGADGKGMQNPEWRTEDEDIWRLVHFVQALAVPEGVEPEVWKAVVAAPATQPTAQVQEAR